MLVNIVSRSLENPAISLNDPPHWEDFGASPADSSVRVSQKSALSYAAVWRAVNLISRDVAKLPLYPYRYGGPEGGKNVDTQHQSYNLVRHKANLEMSAFVFRQTLQAHVLLRGNGYGYIYRNGDGSPDEIVPLLPDVTYPVMENGRLWYVTTIYKTAGPNQPIPQEQRKLRPEDVLHIKGLGYDGLVGYDVLSYARDSFGLGLAARKFGSIYFANKAEPSVVLEHPGKLSPQARTNLRESWSHMHQGLEKSHKVAVLEEGMKVNAFSFNARNSQLLETREFELIEVANWFSLPPHKVGHPARTSYSSLSEENQAYIDECLDGWLVPWEQELREKLLTEEEKETDTHFFEFLRQALVRGDMTARVSYYSSALNAGWMSLDEIRALESMNPIPDGLGKKYRAPLNMQVLGEPVPGAPALPGAMPGGS